MINSRQYRHPVDILCRAPEKNEFGERSGNFEIEDTIYAKIEPLTGREAERAKSFGPSVSHKLTTRYTKKLTAKKTLQYNHRIFTVNAVIDDLEMNGKITVYCTEFPNG